MNPAVVIVAFDRDWSLRRLLGSVENAHFGSPVDLVISIDGSENGNVRKIAESFKWDHGSKEILAGNEHLGLRNHILRCGDLVYDYDGIILLEDDLFVSPHFYQYAKEAIEFYKADSRIAGVSLYSHYYNETARMSFQPIQDNSDVFFLQLPCSWGQCWTRNQWDGFRGWYSENEDNPPKESDCIPTDIVQWPESSWKKFFVKYMIEKGKFFVYPRLSLTTNFGEPGTHTKWKNLLHQVPLQFTKKKRTFFTLDDSLAVYDSYHEILPDRLKLIATHLNEYDFEVDFYAQKTLQFCEREYVLTTRIGNSPLRTYGRDLRPIELNIANEVEGDDISLLEKEMCSVNPGASTFQNLTYYFNIPPEILSAEYQRSESLVLKSIQESLSWKITKPLRWVSSMIRWIKKLPCFIRGGVP